jgi:hypothetical protein
MSDLNQKYVPKACRGKEAIFTGEVVIKIPSFEDRIDLMTASEAGQKKQDEMSQIELLQQTKKLVQASYPFYVKVDITHKATKKHFASADELRYSAKTSEILSDVAAYLLNADCLGES